MCTNHSFHVYFLFLPPRNHSHQSTPIPKIQKGFSCQNDWWVSSLGLRACPWACSRVFSLLPSAWICPWQHCSISKSFVSLLLCLGFFFLKQKLRLIVHMVLINGSPDGALMILMVVINFLPLPLWELGLYPLRIWGELFIVLASRIWQKCCC